MPWFQHISGVTLLSFVVTLPTWPWPDLRSWSCWWRRPTSRREASTNAWTIASQACVWLRRGTKWDGLEAHFNIWGCIKTNLAIFGGMNIHLPVIWGSLGYQGFDSYPYLMISTTSPSQRGPFPARSMACPWDKSAGDCTTSSMVIRCHGENSKNATMRPGKFTTIDWVWKRSTGIYNIYICIIIYIV